ncbi:hypothetical protein CRG98_028108 [Punica granatum]|uniref:Uncharacterized protein n=1 Tax=Punica granatum TaxID=22663 RepID=A0A2I0J5N7_PUNGR|nr:hypothetical protein CRG98_028108 [Punica granatum]
MMLPRISGFPGDSSACALLEHLHYCRPLIKVTISGLSAQYQEGWAVGQKVASPARSELNGLELDGILFPKLELNWKSYF